MYSEMSRRPQSSTSTLWPREHKRRRRKLHGCGKTEPTEVRHECRAWRPRDVIGEPKDADDLRAHRYGWPLAPHNQAM
eukprot:scaffold110355_cov31-Tisochrysis_lutea.AAC.2